MERDSLVNSVPRTAAEYRNGGGFSPPDELRAYRVMRFLKQFWKARRSNTLYPVLETLSAALGGSGGGAGMLDRSEDDSMSRAPSLKVLVGRELMLAACAGGFRYVLSLKLGSSSPVVFNTYHDCACRMHVFG